MKQQPYFPTIAWNELTSPKMKGEYIYLTYLDDDKFTDEVVKVVGTDQFGSKTVLLIEDPSDVSMIFPDGKGVYWDAYTMIRGF